MTGSMIRSRLSLALFPLLVFSVGIAAQAGAGEAILDFATGLFIEGDYELAAEEYSEFAGRYPDHPRAAEAHFRIGECMFRLELYERAAVSYRRALEHETLAASERAVALLRLGRVLAAVGQYQAAAGYYERFISDFPEHGQIHEALYRVGDFLLGAGESEAAAEAFYTLFPTRRSSDHRKSVV